MSPDAAQPLCTVSILGANSHIAKNLIFHFAQQPSYALNLYTRKAEKVTDFLEGISSLRRPHIVEGYRDFCSERHDVIINCIGVGTMRSSGAQWHEYFTVTEKYDNMVLDYLRAHPHALYLCISSGAVYGKIFEQPVADGSVVSIDVNNMQAEDYYSIARIHAEAKHRAFSDLNIIDLRVFSFFSRFINLADGYFITEVLNAVIQDKPLLTHPADMIRDYIHPRDLFRLIIHCMHQKRPNFSVDVVSKKQVNKFELLHFFAERYGLQYEICQKFNGNSATGAKKNYYSTSNRLHALGFLAEFTSMDAIRDETTAILCLKKKDMLP